MSGDLRSLAMRYNLVERFSGSKKVLERHIAGEKLSEEDLKELRWAGELWRQMDWDSKHYVESKELHGYANYFRDHFYGACISEGLHVPRDRDSAYLFLSQTQPKLKRSLVVSLKGVMERLLTEAESLLPQGNV